MYKLFFFLISYHRYEYLNTTTEFQAPILFVQQNINKNMFKRNIIYQLIELIPLDVIYYRRHLMMAFNTFLILNFITSSSILIYFYMAIIFQSKCIGFPYHWDRMHEVASSQ